MSEPWLEWLQGGASRRIPLTGTVTIGRTPGNTIQIDEPGVSRNHCRVTGTNGRIFVDARGSTNGVRVAGKRTQEATLAPGEQFSVGSISFQIGSQGVVSQSAGAPPTTAGRMSLEWTDGATPRSLPVREPISIGRTPDNTIQVNEPGVSRRHAQVSPGAGELFVDARGSTNGIRMAGKRVESARVRPSDSFQVGTVHFGVRQAGGGVAARPASRAWMSIAAAAAVVVIGVGMLLALVAIPGAGGSKPHGSQPSGTLAAVAGPTREVEPYSDEWERVDGPGGASIPLPPGWRTGTLPDGSVALLPQESENLGGDALIYVRFAPAEAYGSRTPANVTDPKPLDVAGISGRRFDDRLAAIPTQGRTVQLPYHGGTFVFFASQGPSQNLAPQLEELLRGVRFE